MAPGSRKKACKSSVELISLLVAKVLPNSDLAFIKVHGLMLGLQNN